MSLRILDDQNFASGKPTEKAATFASKAEDAARLAGTKALQGSYDKLMADSLDDLSTAIAYLALGMRATYILLEKIEREQRMRRP